jgi:NAD+ diphosphatase
MTDEFRRKLTLSRHATNRRAELRNKSELLEQLRNESTTRVLVLSEGKALVRENVLVTHSVSHIDVVVNGTELDYVFLGEATHDHHEVTAGTAFFAVSVDSMFAPDLVTENASWVDLRSIAHHLSDLDAGLFTQALALSNWHDSYRFSPVDGQELFSQDSGWVKESPQNPGKSVFPRTDPAIIVLVTDAEDRVLLGNNAMWDSNRYSLLAGFVEPGESLEAAVIREVKEEAGIVVVNPEYLGSQPWPFPRSLMLGFHARLAPGQNPARVEADGEEILNLRWFSREELVSSLDEIVLPSQPAISRSLIEHWLGSDLDDVTSWSGAESE